MSPRAAVVLLIASACATADPPGEAIGPVIGTTHTSERSRTTALVSLDRGQAPPAAQRLLAVANELDVAPPDLEQAELVHALYALADTLEVLVPDSTSAIVQVRRSAEALERASRRNGGVRADHARAALEAATRALYELEMASVTDRIRYHEAIDTVAVVTAQIDPRRPLQQEFSDIRTAFHELVRAIFAATGGVEPELATPSSTATR